MSVRFLRRYYEVGTDLKKWKSNNWGYAGISALKFNKDLNEKAVDWEDLFASVGDVRELLRTFVHKISGVVLVRHGICLN